MGPCFTWEHIVRDNIGCFLAPVLCRRHIGKGPSSYRAALGSLLLTLGAWWHGAVAGTGPPWPEHLCPGRAPGQEPSSGLPLTDGWRAGGHSERHPGRGRGQRGWLWRGDGGGLRRGPLTAPQVREVARVAQGGTEATGGRLCPAGVTSVQEQPEGTDRGGPRGLRGHPGRTP